uniref:Uncharacterized protein n=1 Tax=Anguilla anguilla TaxID=7936 RepID=A0A0E9X702_ANGAN
MELGEHYYSFAVDNHLRCIRSGCQWLSAHTAESWAVSVTSRFRWAFCFQEARSSALLWFRRICPAWLGALVWDSSAFFYNGGGIASFLFGCSNRW